MCTVQRYLLVYKFSQNFLVTASIYLTAEDNVGFLLPNQHSVESLEFLPKELTTLLIYSGFNKKCPNPQPASILPFGTVGVSLISG
jgi:hypothetical protein